MRPLVGTLHLDDYYDIDQGVKIAKDGVAALHSLGARIEIPHPHRWWEYGTAIQMLLNQHQERMGEIDVLDVGAGWGAVGPVLNLLYNTTVTEYEPWIEVIRDRVVCNQVLTRLGKKGLNLHPFSLQHMPAQQYDAVFCISVLEHVNKSDEQIAWLNLSRLVRPGGLFFMTADVVEDPGIPHIYDNHRAQPNYTLDVMKARVKLMQEHGFTPLGVPDWNWNGNQVHDFTFFRAGMIKEGQWKSVH